LSLRFLVDTNTLSELGRPRPDDGALMRLREASGALATSTTCWHELQYGVARLPASRRRDRLAALLHDIESTVTILPFDKAAAEWLANERARLTRAGRSIPLVDAMIAAVAATRGLTLVTRNTGDFVSLRGLVVESWHR
jgi:tRNA(fMet)-specific endonuclease VapC